MALSLKQQILETINSSNNILIIANKDLNGDNLSASIALVLFFRKFNSNKKNIDIYIDNFSIPEKFSFLPEISNIRKNFDNFRNFVISVDVSNTKINEISYDIKDNKLDFIINSKEGDLSESNVSCGAGNFQYDLIFTIGAPDLESLGTIYDKDPEFFYKVPIVNIDISPNNEKFGQINIINLTATAVSEIIFDLIEAIDIKLIDGDIATSLLTGLISKTKSFKIKKVTPKVLNIASQLMTCEARKEEIVSNLFRTKTIPVLKLWGKALSRLKMDREHNIAWSVVTKQDFLNTNTCKDDINELVDEFITSIPEAKIIVILYECMTDSISAMIRVESCLNALELTKIFNPSGAPHLATFELKDKSLLDGEKEIIDEIKERLK
ncbi:bifunctional oligoribonuclease/PAP phosphatase NrnA [Patescibacteria group bacterium]